MTVRGEGVVGGEEHPFDAPTFSPKQLSVRATLRNIIDSGYVLFHHGLLFARFGLDADRDPVLDYLNEHPDPPVLSIPFTTRLFSGIGAGVSAVDWEHKLLAYPSSLFEGLYRYMSKFGVVDWSNRSFLRLAPQKIPLIDVLALSKLPSLPNTLPTVPVVVFGITSNRSLVGFEPEVSFPAATAQVVVLPPEQETVDIADLLFSEDPCPLRPAEKETVEEITGVEYAHIDDRRCVAGDPPEYVTLLRKHGIDYLAEV